MTAPSTSAPGSRSRRRATSKATANNTWAKGLDVGDDAFITSEGEAAVFRIEPAKVLAFAKEPHGQTTYRFTDD